MNSFQDIFYMPYKRWVDLLKRKIDLKVEKCFESEKTDVLTSIGDQSDENQQRAWWAQWDAVLNGAELITDISRKDAFWVTAMPQFGIKPFGSCLALFCIARRTACGTNRPSSSGTSPSPIQSSRLGSREMFCQLRTRTFGWNSSRYSGGTMSNAW